MSSKARPAPPTAEAAERVYGHREERQVRGDHGHAQAKARCRSCRAPTTTIGAIAIIGIVCDATMYGRKPRRSRRRSGAIATPSTKPTDGAIAKPMTASFAVKSAAVAELRRSRMSARSRKWGASKSG